MSEESTAVAAATFGGLGFVLSLYALLRGTRLNRRDLFLTLHEKLSTPEQVCGRRALREINSPEDVKRMLRKDPDKHGAVTSALAMLDILGLYVDRGYVSKDLALSEWGWVLAGLSRHADHVIEERRRAGGVGRRQWPHFRSLALDAVAWRNRLSDHC